MNLLPTFRKAGYECMNTFSLATGSVLGVSAVTFSDNWLVNTLTTATLDVYTQGEKGFGAQMLPTLM